MEIKRNKPLYEQVYEQIKKAILEGEVNKEKRINEVHLAKDLVVSRGPIRESLRRLEQEGLLVRDKRHHLYIYQPTVDDLVDIYQCRKVLESLAAELAAERLTRVDKEKLDLLISKEEQMIRKESIDFSTMEFVDNNSKFHDVIIHASGNPRLNQQIKSLRGLTYFYRKKNVRGVKRRKTIHEEHFDIYQNLISGKSKETAKLMRDHIDHDLDNLISLFNQNLFLDQETNVGVAENEKNNRFSNTR